MGNSSIQKQQNKKAKQQLWATDCSMHRVYTITLDTYKAYYTRYL